MAVTFFSEPKDDPVASEKDGYPRFKDVEMVRIVGPADSKTIFIAPAHAKTTVKDQDGQWHNITYAQKYPAEYDAFKREVEYTGDGTPVSELTTISAAKRQELRAAGIYTVEQLADLDHTILRRFGMTGGKMRDDARAYLKITGAVVDERSKAKMEAEMDAMRAELAALKGGASTDESGDDGGAEDGITDDFTGMADKDLRDFIAMMAGKPPHSRTGRTKLLAEARALAKAQQLPEGADAV